MSNLEAIKNLLRELERPEITDVDIMIKIGALEIHAIQVKFGVHDDDPHHGVIQVVGEGIAIHLDSGLS